MRGNHLKPLALALVGSPANDPTNPGNWFLGLFMFGLNDRSGNPLFALLTHLSSTNSLGFPAKNSSTDRFYTEEGHCKVASPLELDMQVDFGPESKLVFEDDYVDQGVSSVAKIGDSLLTPFYLVAIGLSLPFLAAYYLGCSLWSLGLSVTSNFSN